MAEAEALEKMRKVIGGVASLPTLPVVIARLTKMLADPDTSVRDVTRLLAEDQAMTAKILKLANSAYYGFPGQIASVDHAVVMLGFGGVRDVALSASVIELFRASPSQAAELGQLFAPDRFWEHSIATGVTCRMLARQRKLADPEEAFVAGLLHDIGKLIMLEHMSPTFLEILRDCRDRGRPFVTAEAERDCSHAAMGRLLVEEWKLPERISEPVGFHHRLRPRRPTAGVTAAVQFADIFARARGVGWAGDDFLPQLEPEASRILGLDELDFPKFIEEFDAQMLQASIFMELAAGKK
ncbi:MAG TPA: HDOD domain-containing protein [Planctomycetota bacterium]|nr:HDOD domain-containing protein [Planctomycetota bacterium]